MINREKCLDPSLVSALIIFCGLGEHPLAFDLEGIAKFGTNLMIPAFFLIVKIFWILKTLASSVD